MADESRRQILSKAALALPLGAVALAAGSESVSAQPRTTQSLTALVTGTGTTATGAAGTFVGTLTVTGVSAANGVLSATGTLVGNLVDATGRLLATVNQVVTIPLAVTGSCQILNLVLGPLHLNLLGLVIDLNQVVLNITAVPGAGNLLGNLLCAVANLLNGGGPLANLLNGLATLLNQIIHAL